MSRWLFPWSASIKKRACRYLLQHYLGHFLQERLSLEQLSVDLYNGSGVIRDIRLDAWSVNELLQSMGAPLELVDGFVGSISVSIPWAALVTENCTVEVSGLQLTCQPKNRTTQGWDSQGWSSCMVSSMQLAQECLKEPLEEPEEPPDPLEGLEMFAQTIETVLRRIRLRFVDTVVRVERPATGGQEGVAVEVHIKRLDYCDEAVKDSCGPALPVDLHQPPAFVHKTLQLSRVQLLYERTRGSQEAGCSGSEGEGEGADPADSAPPQPPLLIGSCSGFMEVTVKIKQNEALPGPKLELDGKLGSLHLLLSPEQIPPLTELLSALSISTEAGVLSDGGKSRPLGSEDLRLIEDDLNKQLSGEAVERGRERGGEEREPCTLSSLDSREMFFSMAPPALSSSIASLHSVSDLSDSELDSSLHSDYSSCQPPPSLAPRFMVSSPCRFEGTPFTAPPPGQQPPGRPTGRPPPQRPLVETLKTEALLRLSIGGLTLTVLQQDPAEPLIGRPGSRGPGVALPLAEVSRRFFEELSFFKDAAFSGRDFQPLRQQFQRACPHSHLRVTGSAMQLVCEQRWGGRGVQELCADLSFSKLEVLESLWSEGGAGGPQYTQVLVFQNTGAFAIGSTVKPCAQIHCKLTERSRGKSSLKSHTVKRSSDVFIELSEFSSEIDLGILDRLDAIIRVLGKSGRGDPDPRTGLPSELSGAPPCSHELSSLRLLSPRAVVELQFPVPDLRTGPERHHWTHKEVREEVLVLDFSELDLRTQASGTSGPVRVETTFTDLHGVYRDAEKVSHPCLRVQKAVDPQWRGPGKRYQNPKIVVTLNPDPGPQDWESVLERSVELDLGSVESPCELRQPESSPFSSKRTMFETEEMVIPGDPEEMAQFQSKTLSCSQCVVELTLPSAHLLLHSKELYSSIYNRINNDLLMWEPSAPPHHWGPSDLPPRPTGQTDTFRMCKSAFQLDSDSDEDDPPVAPDDSAKCKRAEPHTGHAHSFLSLAAHIGKGRICAMTDSKGEGGRKLDGCHGELVLDVDGGTVFSVSQYRGDPLFSYLCIEGQRVELYHRAVVPDSPLPERLEVPSFTPPTHLDPTIYPSEEGAASKATAGRRERGLHMLSTAIKINLETHRNVKEFLVALRLQGATLRHHMAPTNQSWHEQLVDFLDVLDDEILGYTPPAVITVLHTHLLSCAVDYRPLYLPLRVFLTAETFTLSSNIVVDTATFHLRFILDDSALYLSEKCDSEAVDLRKDYVCVLDVDLLELAITTWKGSAGGKLTQPLFELRCSNNVVHLHTCADSGSELLNLVQRVCSNNLRLTPALSSAAPMDSTRSLLVSIITLMKLWSPNAALLDSVSSALIGPQLSESPASLPPCLPAETAEINQCDLADALIDTERSQGEGTAGTGSPLSVRQASPVSVYLFPGERTPLRRSASLEGGGEEGDPDSDRQSQGSTEEDDDFCILEAPGLGIPSRDGEPVVSLLCPGPVLIREGHFSRPLGSTDLLRAPSRFPVPESRILLREISVVWHLYGGRDFGARSAGATGGQEPRVKAPPSGARGSPSRSAGPPRPQNSWRAQGGGGRAHSMLMEIQLTKVSFQHESYPPAPPCGEARELQDVPVSRQVFIVQELEVRDRLASSQINKFLYLHTSEKMPRRAHSNMLSIKALHLQPESGRGGPECCLRVSLMPLRLNIDQDALFFLKDFFTSLAGGINPFLPVETGSEVKPDVSHRAEAESGAGPDMGASMETTYSENSSVSTGSSSSSSDQPIYFREFRFALKSRLLLTQFFCVMVILICWCSCPSPRSCSNARPPPPQGTLAGILIGLAQLNCSELKLKRLSCRHGLLGVDKVISYAVNEWLTDIRKNQLPGILGGVGPMHSVLQLGETSHGVPALRDLFWMPIEQYRKDGRLIRGLQRGAASFGTSTASAALELSNRLVQAIQATAETVYDILSPTPPISRGILDKRSGKRQRWGQQPADLREGVAKAYDTVREGVLDTAQTICDVATRGHEQKGLPGAVGGVLRQIPPTVVRPLIVATEATSNLLGGMRNQIKPDARKEDFLKWRTEENQD
ncbi:autophagy-related protein 2 homolog A [Polyodon spathula]|uniref:autophagy-related protein 2 homolog A n=1 Tax=Polyodon spathula TaxID=7913 RepID=UPI001B7EC63E|nr:autophagy-related protein 2 homolog A [Polyodon spathula]